MIKKQRLRNYMPLVCLMAVALLCSSAMTHGIQGSGLAWMHYFMGYFLGQFALLKFFELRGFVEGFEKYDLLASKWPVYGYAYPFIELLLSLAYFSFEWQIVTYFATLVLSVLGALGVIKALKKGLDVRCACMGSLLNVPLSTVTLAEDIGMGIMALLMLFFHG